MRHCRASYGPLLFDNPNQRKMAMPPEWLLLNRLQWGMNAVLAKLNATAPFPDHFRAAAEAPFRPDKPVRPASEQSIVAP